MCAPAIPEPHREGEEVVRELQWWEKEAQKQAKQYLEYARQRVEAEHEYAKGEAARLGMSVEVFYKLKEQGYVRP